MHQTPPISTERPLFRFPEFSYEEISPGMKIIFYNDNTQPLINIRINFNNGASCENIPGLMKFTLKLMTTGTKKRSYTDISNEIETIGASLSANAGWDEAMIGISCLNSFTSEAIDILFDLTFNSVFDNKEIERYRKKHVSSLQQNLTNSSYLAQMAFNSGIYENHSYARPLKGTIDSVEKITQSDIIGAYKKLLSDRNVWMVVSGNFDKENISKNIREKIKQIKLNKSQENQIDSPRYPEKSRIILIEKSRPSQTSIRIGKQSINMSHPDYYALQVANTIFGGFFMSRLNELLREEKGYTYGIGSTISTRKNASIFGIASEINLDATRQAIDDILSEMQKMTEEPVNEDELNRAIQYIMGSFSRSIETPGQISSLIQTMISFNLGTDYFDIFYKRMSNINAEEVFEIQKKYFKPENLVLAAAGNINHLNSILGDLGEVYVCNKNAEIQLYEKNNSN